MKKDNINLRWWIISAAIIAFILLLVLKSFAITYIDSGNCLILPNSTQICSSKVICSSISQNITCKPSAVSCNYNLSCPDPVITNKINNTVVNIEQPLVSRDFLKTNMIPILVIVAGIALLISWRAGWLNKLKEIKMPKQQEYYDNVQRYPQREFKEPTDFNELK